MRIDEADVLLPQPTQHTISFALSHIAVHTADVVEAALQSFKDLLSAAFRAAEDDGLTR